MKKRFTQLLATTLLALSFTGCSFSISVGNDKADPSITPLEESSQDAGIDHDSSSDIKFSFGDVNHNTRVIDNADVFSFHDTNNLEQAFDKIERQDNIVVAVETLDSLNGADIHQYTTNRHNELGIGDREYDNGLFFVLAIDDRDYFVTMGDGLTQVSETELEQLLENTLPDAFREGNYADGVILAAERFTDGETGGGFFKVVGEFSHFFIVGGIMLGMIVFAKVFGKPSKVEYPSQKKKQQILQRNAEIYQDISKRGILAQFEQEQGLEAREALLRDRGIIKKREAYQEYHDRQIIDEHYDIWTYTEGDSIEFMKLRQKQYNEVRASGELTPEVFYETLSLEERLDFQSGKRRRELIEKKGMNFNSIDDQRKFFDLEQGVVGLVATDNLVRNYRRRELERKRRSSSSSSRGGGRTSGRGAGGSW